MIAQAYIERQEIFGKYLKMTVAFSATAILIRDNIQIPLFPKHHYNRLCFVNFL